jgi:hypothetical protein
MALSGVKELLTYLMVRKTGAMVESSEKTATAAANEASAALRLAQIEQDQMRDARLPIVLPVTGSLGVSSTSKGNVQISVRVENIGVGPALALNIRLEMLHQYGDPSVAPQPLQVPTQRPGLAPSTSHEFRAQFRRLPTEPVFPFRVHVEYTNVFGDRYRVVGRFFPDEGIFKELKFQALDKRGLPVSTLAAS